MGTLKFLLVLLLLPLLITPSRANDTFNYDGANVVLIQNDRWYPDQIKYELEHGARTFRVQLINLAFWYILTQPVQGWFLDPTQVKTQQDADNYYNSYLNYDGDKVIWKGIAKQLDILENTIIPNLRKDFANYDVRLIIDLHSPPGICIDANDSTRLVRYIDTPYFSKMFVNVWKLIATRLKNYHEIVAFDLENEPTNIASSVFIKRYKQTIATIRKTGAKQTLIVESGEDPRSILKQPKYTDPNNNLIYSIHWYYPHEFTFWSDPNRLPLFSTYKARIDKVLTDVRKWQISHGNPRIWIGEYGLDPWKILGNESLKFLKHINNAWAKYGWGNNYYGDFLPDTTIKSQIDTVAPYWQKYGR